MIQSLQEARLEQIVPRHFDVVVVDEFHHAAAATYDRLLEPSLAAGATGADRDAGAHGRAGRHELVRPTDRRRAAALGGDRRGLPGSVPVLRRRGRNRPRAKSHGGAAATCSRNSSDLCPGDDRSRRQAAGGDSSAIVLDPTHDARARLLRLQWSTPSSWRVKFTAGRAGARRAIGADAPRHERDAALRALRGRRAPLWCSPSRFSARASTCPSVDMRAPASADATARRYSRSSLGAACAALTARAYLTVIDLIGQQHREFRFDGG